MMGGWIGLEWIGLDWMDGARDESTGKLAPNAGDAGDAGDAQNTGLPRMSAMLATQPGLYVFTVFRAFPHL